MIQSALALLCGLALGHFWFLPSDKEGVLDCISAAYQNTDMGFPQDLTVALWWQLIVALSVGATLICRATEACMSNCITCQAVQPCGSLLGLLVRAAWYYIGMMVAVGEAYPVQQAIQGIGCPLQLNLLTEAFFRPPHAPDSVFTALNLSMFFGCFAVFAHVVHASNTMWLVWIWIVGAIPALGYPWIVKVSLSVDHASLYRMMATVVVVLYSIPFELAVRNISDLPALLQWCCSEPIALDYFGVVLTMSLVTLRSRQLDCELCILAFLAPPAGVLLDFCETKFGLSGVETITGGAGGLAAKTAGGREVPGRQTCSCQENVREWFLYTHSLLSYNSPENKSRVILSYDSPNKNFL